MTAGITVIVPTIGRDSLGECLSSFASDLRPEDAVVVIADGGRRHVLNLVADFSLAYPEPDWTYDWIWPEGCWGHPAANYALDHHVITSHFWRIDDDDQAAPGALDALHDRLDNPWTVFRMTFGAGHFANGVTCWREPVLRYGDIGTPMVLSAVGDARYGDRYQGDWDFVEQLRFEHGEPAWDERVVALIRPVSDDPLAA